MIFLALQVAGTLGQRSLGKFGFYAVSIVGGFVSSASAVASAATLSAQAKIPGDVTGIGAVLASLASALVNLPLVDRVSGDCALTRRLARPIAVIVGGGLGGLVLRALVVRLPAEPWAQHLSVVLVGRESGPSDASGRATIEHAEGYR